jgi:hypothetical protein
MTTHCGVEQVPVRNLAFGEITCRACLVAMTRKKKK